MYSCILCMGKKSSTHFENDATKSKTFWDQVLYVENNEKASFLLTLLDYFRC